jgi:glyoxylate/hydroxypyruvate reductase
MKKVPFISQLKIVEQEQWINQLNLLIDHVEIVLPDHISKTEKYAVEMAIVANPSEQQITQFPNLIWVQSLWAGVERLVKMLPDDIALVRLVDPQLAETMAEAVLAWTLYLQRNMPFYAQQQQNKTWKQLPAKLAKETRVSVLGAGELGITALHYLSKFNYQLKYWNRSNKQLNNIVHYQGRYGLQAMLSETDILISLLPLTDETHYLLNDETLKWLPKGAQLINFSRGAILDTSSLLPLLEDGSIAHAVLDVFEQEPLPSCSTLWSHPDITVLPHISAPTNIITASKIAAKNIANYVTKQEIPVAVDRSKGY